MWKILVVDDLDDMHLLTKALLKTVEFDQCPIHIMSAYSAEEGFEILKSERDIALVLLDVVMETDHAGLNLVHRIRHELKNKLVRIILRTGQPNLAPMRKVILDYDINDYREKSELRSEGLFSCVISALRSYRDLCELDQARSSMRRLIEASPALVVSPTLQDFAEESLKQLKNILMFEDDDLEAVWVLSNATLCQYHVIAALGTALHWLGLRSSSEFTPMINRFFRRALRERKAFFEGKVFIATFPSMDDQHQFLYLKSSVELTSMQKELVWAFIAHAKVSSQNLGLRQELHGIQSEIFNILGEAVETRSLETGHHVMRIASYVDLIAREMGMSDVDRNQLRQASPLHDVGKIGIPDYILNKPERYTPSEFEIMKNHATLGRDILIHGKHPLFKAASIIAYEHHERWDGGGYPRGLRKQTIHVFGRITAIADVFDALSMSRCYKEPWPLEKIITYFRDERNHHFDGQLVDLFLAKMDEVLELKTSMMP